MKAVTLTGVKQIAIADYDRPTAKQGYVLVRVRSASICGTDTHMYEGHVRSTYPRILGHDFSGVVEDAPPESEFRMGQRVLVQPSFPCGSCGDCAKGRTDLCKNKKLIGLHSDGCFREFILAPESNLISLPENVTFEDASILEPFCVSLNAFDRVKLGIGERVVVLGVGPMGLGAAAVAKLCGAGEIIAVDIRNEALEAASRYGATSLINIEKKSVRDEIMRLTNNAGADVVVETAGSSKAVSMMVELVKKEGKLVNIGVVRGIGSHDIEMLTSKTLTVYGVGGNGGRGKYQRALLFTAKGLISPSKMVTHKFPLVEAAKAFELHSSKTGNVIKVLLTF